LMVDGSCLNLWNISYVQVKGSWRLLVCLSVQSTLFTCSIQAVSTHW
jgi:hypothetical protein